MDAADGRYTERIDYVMVRSAPSCRLDVEASALFATPLAESYRGLFWPSDHAGVVTELRCDTTSDSQSN